jgi:hypothetical protein
LASAVVIVEFDAEDGLGDCASAAPLRNVNVSTATMVFMKFSLETVKFVHR